MCPEPVEGPERGLRRLGPNGALTRPRRTHLRPQPLTAEAEQRGQQGQRDQHRDAHADGGGDAHRGQERDPGHGQPAQRDDHGQPGEDHCGAGGGHGSGRGLLRRHPVAQLVAVPGGDEQGVVDADGQAEHQGQQRGGRGDRGDAVAPKISAMVMPTPEHGGEQRHPGRPQRAEGDHQHHQRDQHADALGEAQSRSVVAVRLTAHGGLPAGDLGLELGGLLGQGVEGGLGDVAGLGLEPQRDDRGPVVVGDHAPGELVEG